MYGVAEPGRLDRGERLGTAYARLAVEDDLTVLRQGGECLARQDVTLGYQYRTGDLHDLVLGRLPDVDQVDGLVRLEPLAEFVDGDGGTHDRLGGLVGHRAAEVVVVDQSGHRGVLSADRAVGV